MSWRFIHLTGKRRSPAVISKTDFEFAVYFEIPTFFFIYKQREFAIEESSKKYFWNKKVLKIFDSTWFLKVQ